MPHYTPLDVCLVCVWTSTARSLRMSLRYELKRERIEI